MATSTLEMTGARASTQRLGMKLFLVSEGFLFGSLFWTYYYLRALTPGWPPHHPEALLAGINTAILLAGSGTVQAGLRAIRKGREKTLSASLLVTGILGAIFVGITIWEWAHEGFTSSTDAYGSIFFTLTGFHAFHVSGGVALMLVLFRRSLRHGFSADNPIAVEVGSMYWHFIDAVWILVFTTIFIIR
jgi:cytochrome c oxidase subunit 3